MPDTAPVTVVPSTGFTPVVAPVVAPAGSATQASAPTTPASAPTTPAAAYRPAGEYPPAVTYPPAPSSYPATPGSSSPTGSSYPGSAFPGTTYPGSTFPAAYGPGPTAGSTAAERPGPGRALGIGSLALGAFALLGAALPVVNIASIGLAAIGAGLGLAALFQLSRSRGIALAGAVVSIVALTTSVAFATVYTGVVTSAAGGLLSGLDPLPSIVDDGDDYGDGYEEETIAAADPDGASGTALDPIPLGETIVVARDGEPRWEITLADPTYDAEEEVLLGSGASDVSSDLFGDAAQFAYVSAEITYLGAEPTSMYEEVYVCFATVDESFSCGGELLSVAPGTDLSLIDEIEPGDTVSGNILVAIPAAAEDGGHWTVAGQWTDFLYLPAR